MLLPELPGGSAAWYAAAFLLWCVALVVGLARLRVASPALPVLVTAGSAALLGAAVAGGRGCSRSRCPGSRATRRSRSWWMR